MDTVCSKNLVHSSIFSRVSSNKVNVSRTSKVCRNSLSGRHKEVLIVKAGRPPFIFYSAEDNEATGVDIDLLKILSKKLGFTYDIRFVNIWSDARPLVGSQWFTCIT